MKFSKKGQATLLIAAFVSVLAITGLLLYDQPSNTGQAVVTGLAEDYNYRHIGIRDEVSQFGWETGYGLGDVTYPQNQGNRGCITDCGPICDAKYTGKAVNDCFQWCKSGCEKRQRELVVTGGYYTP